MYSTILAVCRVINRYTKEQDSRKIGGRIDRIVLYLSIIEAVETVQLLFHYISSPWGLVAKGHMITVYINIERTIALPSISLYKIP